MTPKQARERVRADLVSLRRRPGGVKVSANVADLEALLTIPDLLAHSGLSERRIVDLAIARLTEDIERLPTAGARQVAEMMFCVGRSYWADPSVRVGQRRADFVADSATAEFNMDTLRTRREPAVVDQLVDLLLTERPALDDNAASSTLLQSGVRAITTDFYRGVPWDKLVAGAKEIDLFFTYGRTWRRSLAVDFHRMVAGGTRVRVLLPDLSDQGSDAFAQNALKFNQTLEELRSNVQEAYSVYLDAGAEVRSLNAVQSYSYYRFDDVAVASLYNHQRGRVARVPTFVFERGGSLFEFFSADFDAMFARPSSPADVQMADLGETG